MLKAGKLSLRLCEGVGMRVTVNVEFEGQNMLSLRNGEELKCPKDEMQMSLLGRNTRWKRSKR